MFSYYLFCSALFFTAVCIKPGPRFPPTKGAIWPHPQKEMKEDNYFVLKPEEFEFKVTNHTCDILTRALARYTHHTEGLQRIIDSNGGHRPRSSAPFYYVLHRLAVNLRNPCEDMPHMEMDEKYSLIVTITSRTLVSDSIWGILRGLESFYHLLYLDDDYSEIRLNMTSITDFPRYPHRGLLLDTSRHFVSLSRLRATLDAMAMNKMNVFHWHIVDDESFPLRSERFPEMSRGAFHPSMVYTKTDIQKLIEYARDRGIRIVPEIDVPGHTRSWGVSHPEILTPCYEDKTAVGLGPLNPLRQDTYDILRDLIGEVQSWFPDEYFHIGGDEVEMKCWRSNPDIQEYMRAHNVQDVKELHGLFMGKVLPLLRGTPVVWQEVFDEGVTLSKDTVVQVWQNEWIIELLQVLQKGHRVLFSSAWYLDHLDSNGDWEKYYAVDPRSYVNDPKMADLIIGGEACMWGEVVDDNNVISRVWPRASAVAEVLWGAGSVHKIPLRQRFRPRPAAVTDDVKYRLEEHACRMMRRGIHAQPPNGPGFCLTKK